MTMRPGPMMAARVSSLRRHVLRGATSLSRIVPNAPWMSPTCASSRTAEVGLLCESTLRGSRSPKGTLDSAARFDPVAPLLGDQRFQEIVNRDRSDQVAGRVDHSKRDQV